MPRTNDIEYTYAVSRIRAVEKKLLDKSKLDRMVDAKTAEESIKVLMEADYGYANSESINVYEYERLLAEEQKKAYALLREVAPEPEIFNLFLQVNDYHNAKIILKGEFSGQEHYESLLMESSSIPVNKMKSMIKDRKLSDMPAVMRSAIEECIDVFNRTGDPQFIDLILDKGSFRQMKEMAAGQQSDFLKNLVVILIDLTNLKILLRVKALKKSWDFLQRVLIPGGSINTGIFSENLEAPLESLLEALGYSQYSSFLEEALESLKSTGSMTRFEKLSDNFIINFVKKAKYLSFGVEPLIGYLMAKENEIKNARIIMVGKINNISSDILRERLRDTYV